MEDRSQTADSNGSQFYICYYSQYYRCKLRLSGCNRISVGGRSCRRNDRTSGQKACEVYKTDCLGNGCLWYRTITFHGRDQIFRRWLHRGFRFAGESYRRYDNASGFYHMDGLYEGVSESTFGSGCDDRRIYSGS